MKKAEDTGDRKVIDRSEAAKMENVQVPKERSVIEEPIVDKGTSAGGERDPKVDLEMHPHPYHYTPMQDKQHGYNPVARETSEKESRQAGQ